MPQPLLGNLETKNLRDLWINEERDFTPWLAENIDQLAAVLEMPITVHKGEKRIGRYELDIFARGPNNEIVIIENQLGATDHTHLGQLLTYAAGLEAAIIVWIAPEVRDEHRSAVKWLNDKTVDGISFFLVRPEVFSIDESLPAIKFYLEAAPSEFARQLRDVAQSEDSPWRAFLRNFWADLYPYLAAHGHFWAQGRSTTSLHYVSSSVGKTGVTVNVSLTAFSPRISLSIWLESQAAKEQFDLLAANKATIEAEFPGQDLCWDRKDMKVAASLFIERPYDREKISEATPEREALFLWIAENLTRFRSIAKRFLVEAQIG